MVRLAAKPLQSLTSGVGLSAALVLLVGLLQRQPVKVRAPIPQGDALSPAVMNLLLAAPMRRNVDDRAWASPSANECAAVFQKWHEHTPLIGLVENPRKAQVTHKAVAGRRRLLAIPFVSAVRSCGP